MPLIVVTVFGEAPIQAKLDRRQGLSLRAAALKGSKAATTVLKPFIMAQSPVRTGKLRKSISVRKNKQGVGYNVGPRAPHRHFIIRGTSRGVEPNPFVGRGGRAGMPAARTAFNRAVSMDIRT